MSFREDVQEIVDKMREVARTSVAGYSEDFHLRGFAQQLEELCIEDEEKEVAPWE